MTIQEENKAELDRFIGNIMRLRRENGLSEHEMAEIMGVDDAVLSIIEQGELPDELGADVILRLAAYFGVKPSQLFKQQID